MYQAGVNLLLRPLGGKLPHNSMQTMELSLLSARCRYEPEAGIEPK